ncbi:MAG TPA: phosphatidate cytidylyltransferase [Methylotenera sp.]|nr:phosphatidate cytidylyltransferase [Methylotenera sp.]
MLKTRVNTAAMLIAGFLTAMFLASNMGWALLTLVVTLIAAWEWSNLIKLNKSQMYSYVTLALVLSLTIFFTSGITFSTSATLYHDVFVLNLLGIVTLFWVLLAPIWLITRKIINHQLALAILGLLLLLSTWVALVELRVISPWLLLSVIATVSIADSAAYFAGKRFGRHKLAPEISPGKTWEGVAGGLLAVTIYGTLLCYFLNYSYWFLVGFWLIVVLSIMGDLLESLLKRQAGIKDSSQLLPGHGGILDRMDGLIPSLALSLFYIYLPLYANIQ